MSSCKKCGKLAFGYGVKLRDMRTGTNMSVRTSADLAGSKAMLSKRTGNVQTKQLIKNPLNGK